MKPVACMPLTALAALLAGCASSLSGIGGRESYACKAPEGVLCTSVSGVYANSVHGAPLVGRATAPPLLEPPVTTGAELVIVGSRSPPAASPKPDEATLRSSPRVLRLWIAPWEDRDGDLHEESIVNVVVDTGRWLIEHVRPVPGDRFRDVAPPVQIPAEERAKPADETGPAPNASTQPAVFLPAPSVNPSDGR